MSAADAVQNPPVQTEEDDNNPSADFSSYFTIHNQLSVPLVREKWGQSEGSWVGEPPQTIKPGFTTSELKIKDQFGLYGSAGWVTYTARVGDDGLARTIRFEITCPYSGSNSAKVTSTDPQWLMLSVTPFSTEGHPLKVTFTVEAAPAH